VTDGSDQDWCVRGRRARCLANAAGARGRCRQWGRAAAYAADARGRAGRVSCGRRPPVHLEGMSGCPRGRDRGACGGACADAVATWLGVCGPADPATARRQSEFSLRAVLGADASGAAMVHASESHQVCLAAARPPPIRGLAPISSTFGFSPSIPIGRLLSRPHAGRARAIGHTGQAGPCFRTRARPWFRKRLLAARCDDASLRRCMTREHAVPPAGHHYTLYVVYTQHAVPPAGRPARTPAVRLTRHSA
jgi:hypothetical protein